MNPGFRADMIENEDFFQDSSALTELYLASRLCCSELNHINLMLMPCALPTCLRRGEGEGLRC